MTVYEPQVDSWDGGFLKLRAAVAVKPDTVGMKSSASSAPAPIRWWTSRRAW